MPSHGTAHLFESRENPPQHYLIAFTDGGARGNPGPSGYGVVIKDESGRKVATLSKYLGHQTNNFAEYQGLIGALEYALKHGPKALKVISDSELLVRQIKGIYKVKNPTLQDLHARAKELVAQMDWFSIIRKPTVWPMKLWTRAWAERRTMLPQLVWPRERHRGFHPSRRCRWNLKVSSAMGRSSYRREACLRGRGYRCG
jgi:ribonuclease HI